MANDSATATRALATARTTRTRLTPLAAFGVIVGIAAAVLILYPIVSALLSVFISEGRLDFGPIASAFEIKGLWTTVLNTVIFVVVSGSLAVLVGTLLAWLNERTDARMGTFGAILPIVPLLIPPLAVAVGFVFLFSPRAGLVNVLLREAMPWLGLETGPFDIFTWGGMIFVLTLELVPFVYLMVSAALRNVNPALDEASRISGSGPIRTLLRVTLPAIRPAIGASALLVTVLGLASYSIPAILGTTAGVNVLALQIIDLQRGQYPPRTAEAVVLGLMILVVVLTAWIFQSRLERSTNVSTIGGKGSRASTASLGPWRLVGRAFMIAYLAFAIMLPLLGLIYVSFQKFWTGKLVVNLTFDNFVRAFGTLPGTVQAMGNSLVLAGIGATIGIVIAFVIALANWQRPTRLTGFFNSLLKLPAGFSAIVIAIGFIVAFARPPIVLVGTPIIILLAYIVLYLPQGSIAVGATVTQVDRSLNEASHVSGAGDFRSSTRILLPLMLPGLVVGWIFLFVFMNGEVTASVLLGSTATPVVGYKIIELWTGGGSVGSVAAYALGVTMVCTVMVVLSLVLSRRWGGVRR